MASQGGCKQGNLCIRNEGVWWNVACIRNEAVVRNEEVVEWKAMW